MRGFGALVVVVASEGVAQADRSVTGRVIDGASGAPVAGALVTVGTGEAGTDDKGHFTIGNLAHGRLDVVVIADGYRAYFGSARINVELVVEMTAEASS